MLEEPAQLAQALGLRVQETGGIQIKTVLRGGAAERAGFAAGDEWIGLETPATGKSQKAPRQPNLGWRLGRLDELPLYAGSSKKITALVARDKRLLRLTLTMPTDITTWRLLIKDAALVKKWLVSAA